MNYAKTYDEWKLRSDRDDGPPLEPDSWCDKCEHDACDCPCCTEPAHVPVISELLVGCGSSRVKQLARVGREAWSNLVTLDIEPRHNPNVIADLNLPLPFGDETFAEVHAYEILEHLGRQGDFQSFFRVFAELWRILRPDGRLFASVPDWRSLWAFGDPGHTRVINEGTLRFLDRDAYADVGTTPMSDYRDHWPHSFKTEYTDYHGERFWFVLRAV